MEREISLRDLTSYHTITTIVKKYRNNNCDIIAHSLENYRFGVFVFIGLYYIIIYRLLCNDTIITIETFSQKIMDTLTDHCGSFTFDVKITA